MLFDKYEAACFTGHRPKGLYGYRDRSAYYPLRDALGTAVERLNDEMGIETFVSGGAQGLDQLAFWAVENVKKRRPNIKNVVFVPFRGQEDRWLDRGMFSKHEYGMMLERADCVRYVGTKDVDGTAVELLMRRNEAMLNASCAVISAYAGPESPLRAKGGTAAAIRSALNRGMPVYNIDPKTMEVTYPAFRSMCR